MDDFFNFRTMITPWLIKVIFVLSMFGCVGLGILEMIGAETQAERILGAATALLGPFVVRMACESAIVMFRLHDALVVTGKDVVGIARELDAISDVVINSEKDRLSREAEDLPELEPVD